MIYVIDQHSVRFKTIVNLGKGQYICSSVVALISILDALWNFSDRHTSDEGNV